MIFLWPHTHPLRMNPGLAQADHSCRANMQKVAPLTKLHILHMCRSAALCCPVYQHGLYTQTCICMYVYAHTFVECNWNRWQHNATFTYPNAGDNVNGKAPFSSGASAVRRSKTGNELRGVLWGAGNPLPLGVCMCLCVRVFFVMVAVA